MKQKYIYTSLFLGGLGLIQGSVFAALLPSFERDANSIIISATGAVGNYDIDLPWDIAESVGRYLEEGRKLQNEVSRQEEELIQQTQEQLLHIQSLGGIQNIFHESVNCLINDAIRVSTERTNTKIEEEYRKSGQTGTIDLLSSDFEVNCSIDGVDLETVIARQEKIRKQQGLPETTCPESEDLASYCRVSEALMTELQAYSLYLDIKSNDNESINAGVISQEPAQQQNQNLGTFEDFSLSRDQRIQAMQNEILITERSIMGVLDFYRQYDIHYQTYARHKAINTNLQESLNRLEKMSQIIDLFPKKFINATLVR